MRVSDRLAVPESGTSLKPMPPWAIRLVPMIRLLRLIPGAGPTLTGAVIVVIPGEVTVRFAEPCATPVTANVALSCPAGTVTVAGTVAAAVLSDARLKVMPPVGAAADMVSVRFTVLVALMLTEVGLSEAVTVTVTVPVSGAKPTAVAVTCVEPMATPVTCGFAAGMSRPAGTKTLDVMVATEVLALLKLIVRPPGGAAKERLTGRLPLWPGAKAGIVPKLTKLLVTMRGAVALLKPVADAVNTTLPAVAPAVSAKAAVVWPA